MIIPFENQRYVIRFFYSVGSIEPNEDKSNIGKKALNNLQEEIPHIQIHPETKQPILTRIKVGKRVFTTCKIDLQTGTNEENKPIYTNMASGLSVRNPFDMFDKSLGRRKSLSAALKSLNMKDNRFNNFVWDQYFTYHNDIVGKVNSVYANNDFDDPKDPNR